MDQYERAVREEVRKTIDRAAFDGLSPDGIHVEITPSFRRRLGDCKPVVDSTASGNESSEFVIRIAKRLFTDRSDAIWRDTVRHEVAHAAVFAEHGDGIGHGAPWKRAAERAGAKPTACYDGDANLIDARYILACPNGCTDQGYLKRSKRIQQPWRYSCGKCSTSLISYDVDDPPDDPNPGTCYVASIAWDGPRFLLACPEGCFRTGYLDETAEIREPASYQCGNCGARTISYPAGKRPSDLTPGTRFEK